MQTRSTDAAWDSAKWWDHLSQLGIENKRVGEYYGIDISDAGGSPRDRALQMAKEVFPDLVASGAFVLPLGKNVDEFKFSIRNCNHVVGCLVISHGGKTETVTIYPGAHYDPSKTFKQFTEYWSSYENSVIFDLFAAMVTVTR